MSKTICFDRTAEAKRILKSGISATSAHARSELRTAAWYLINKTTYTAKQIEERLRSVSSDYFKGMPEEYINASIQEIMLSVQYGGAPDGTSDRPPSITIYKEELEKIAALGHDDTERLAFVYLCVAKMKPYKHIHECNAELYRLAWKYSYDSTTKRFSADWENGGLAAVGPQTVSIVCVRQGLFSIPCASTHPIKRENLHLQPCSLFLSCAVMGR